MPLPTADLRTNLGTWAIKPCQVPSVAHFMHDALPNETYDPHFMGQTLKTHYFDTKTYALLKARVKRDQYITVRVRCYQAPGMEEVYALSAKTEKEKFRVEIDDTTAHKLIQSQNAFPAIASLVPANLADRLLETIPDEEGQQPLVPVRSISCQRYAIEDDQDRYTLDTNVKTDLHKCMPFSVLEFKSTQTKDAPPALQLLKLTPIKLSKFIWACTL